MFLQIKNMLFNSDWHLIHRNILLYEYEARKEFIYNISKEEVEEIIKENDSDTILMLIYTSSHNLMKKLNDELEEILKTETITEYYNLWDFIFNLSKNKLDLFFKEWELRDELYRFFNILKKHNIKSYLILWNHDQWKKWDDFVKLFYDRMFDEVHDYLFIWKEKNILLSHYPFLKKSFHEEEEKLFKKIRQKDVMVNIHWHIHTNELNEELKIKHIKYKNVCIDLLLTEKKWEI